MQAMQVKCIKKFRDKHNKIIGYRLVAANGQMQDVKAEKLKEAMATGSLNVINLTLTKDGRLVDKAEKQPQIEKARESKPKNKQNSIIVKDHQPILFSRLLNGSRLKGTELLRFKIVDSLSSTLSKANLLGAVEIEKITDDMYMIYSADNKTATIVSEAPVRVLAEEDDALGELVNTIDFRNADLSRIKSLDNVVGKAKSTYSSLFNTTTSTGTNTKAVQHSLDEIKKINHSIVSRYKYKKPDPFNNKEADSSLSVADTLCSIWTWAWVTNWELDDIFEDFAVNACASLGEAYGLYGLERQDTSYIFDLLSLNWDGVTSVDNMSYTEATAAWAISRVLATHDLMSHLDTIVKEYTNPIYHSLTNKNIESAMEGRLAKKDVIEQLGYGDDIDGTYDEFMGIIRKRVCDYGKQKFSNHLETCIKYFKSTGDKKASDHFSEIYKCVKGVIDY